MFFLTRLKNPFCVLLLSAVLSPGTGFAAEKTFDPKEETPTLPETIKIVKEENKPAMKWLWEDQLYPTIQHASDVTSLWIFVAGAAATSYAHQHDSEFRERYGDNKGLSQNQTKLGAVLGSGFPGIAIALSQMYFDTDDGLQHLRAIGFTSLTHITIAEAVQRERPNGKRLSFPSGHTSSAFASAASVAYSYGPWAGVPAFAAATYIGLSRVANNAHWLSDIVAGAGLGIYWARASAQVGIVNSKTSYYPIYTPSEAGPMVGLGVEHKF